MTSGSKQARSTVAPLVSQPVDLDVLLQRGYRYALSLTHDKALAEDLLQDAWVSLLQAGAARNRRTSFALCAAVSSTAIVDSDWS